MARRARALRCRERRHRLGRGRTPAGRHPVGWDRTAAGWDETSDSDFLGWRAEHTPAPAPDGTVCPRRRATRSVATLRDPFGTKSAPRWSGGYVVVTMTSRRFRQQPRRLPAHRGPAHRRGTPRPVRDHRGPLRRTDGPAGLRARPVPPGAGRRRAEPAGDPGRRAAPAPRNTRVRCPAQLKNLLDWLVDGGDLTGNSRPLGALVAPGRTRRRPGRSGVGARAQRRAPLRAGLHPDPAGHGHGGRGRPGHRPSAGGSAGHRGRADPVPAQPGPARPQPSWQVHSRLPGDRRTRRPSVAAHSPLWAGGTTRSNARRRGRPSHRHRCAASPARRAARRPGRGAGRPGCAADPDRTAGRSIRGCRRHIRRR